MKSTLIGTVLGAKRYEINGQKSATLYAFQNENQTDDLVGWEVLKFSCPWDVVDQLKQHREQMPCDFEIDTVMAAAGKDKNTSKVVAIRHKGPSSSLSSLLAVLAPQVSVKPARGAENHG